MIFEIEFSRDAENFLRKSEKQIALRIIEKLETLKSNPAPSNSKFIGRENNEKLFRYRIGDCRALYKIKEEVKIILIVKIDKRSRVYD